MRMVRICGDGSSRYIGRSPIIALEIVAQCDLHAVGRRRHVAWTDAEMSQEHLARLSRMSTEEEVARLVASCPRIGRIN